MVMGLNYTARIEAPVGRTIRKPAITMPSMEEPKKKRQQTQTEQRNVPSLTHALRPKSDELRLWGRPGTGQHSIESARETLDDAISRDAGGHRAEGGRSKCDS